MLSKYLLTSKISLGKVRKMKYVRTDVQAVSTKPLALHGHPGGCTADANTN